jgi:hypothetical protein
MISFPQTMPTDAMMLVVDRLRGKKPDVGNKEFCNALWNIVGYAADQVVPDDKQIFQETEVSLEDFATILEQAIPQGEFHGNPITIGIIPWAIVLKTALKLLISVFL